MWPVMYQSMADLFALGVCRVYAAVAEYQTYIPSNIFVLQVRGMYVSCTGPSTRGHPFTTIASSLCNGRVPALHYSVSQNIGNCVAYANGDNGQYL